MSLNHPHTSRPTPSDSMTVAIHAKATLSTSNLSPASEVSNNNKASSKSEIKESRSRSRSRLRDDKAPVSEGTAQKSSNSEKVVNKKQMAGKDEENENSPGKEKYFFFYGKQSPFSQHHPAQFTIDGVLFNCAEQYMMYSKAVTFDDDKMKQMILSSSNPVEQKRLGRRVQNFVKEIWDEQSVIAVKKASRAKFSQNEDLKQQLFSTHPCVMAEASPRDTIWGIGLGASNPKARNRMSWRGRNKLGFILTEVRDELMKEETGAKASAS